MQSLLAVTTKADNLALLTDVQRRNAIGTTATTYDDDLAALDLRLAAAIASECNVAIGSGGEPTLKQETLTETFRCVDVPSLPLSRRHNIDITSVTEDDIVLAADTDYVVDPESGLMTRLCEDHPRRWCASKIVVVYKAGFETLPGDLVQAAMDFMRLAWFDKDRDPSLRSLVTDIKDIERVEKTWWVGSVPGQASASAVPDIVAGRLTRFRNVVAL